MIKLEDLKLDEEQMKAVELLIQSETDKVRTKYRRELESVKGQLSEFSDKQEEIEQMRKSLEAEKSKLELSKKLKEKNIPAELSDFLVLGDDAENSLDVIAKAISQKSLESVDAPSTHTRAAAMTREDFQKMGFLDRLKLRDESPILYAALNN